VLERRIDLPGAAESPLHARRALRTWLAETDEGAGLAAGLTVDEDQAADAVLLASELCDNAVLHAGTGFALRLAVTDTSLTVTVTDHGVQALERYLSAPRPTTGRAATHGRGLLLIERMSDAWGTRHDSAGHHTWFQLNRPRTASSPCNDTIRGVEATEAVTETHASTTEGWPAPEAVRRLLHLSRRLGDELDLAEQLTELLRRLSEVTELTGARVLVDYGDDQGERALASIGVPMSAPVAAADHAPVDPGSPERSPVAGADLHLRAPLRGRLTVAGGDAPTELLELCAHRIALSIQADWLTGVDHRQRAWMNYLGDASELLSQPRELELTAAIVPQIVVPRLGPWCVVHIYDTLGRLNIAALTHHDEDRIEPLREVMSGPLVRELMQLTQHTTGPTRFSAGPLPLVATPLVSRGRVRGVLSVAAPEGRAHTPEEIMVLRDLARRASLAIDNAQHLAAHKATSQALQRALLPRAVPTAPGIEFAAEYLPASSAVAVGGDFYGVLELAQDSRWLSFIGDVCGKGPTAAARTAVVREVLGALMRDGRPSVQALEGVNKVLMEACDPYQFCTLAAALISRPEPALPPGLDVGLVLAGHEPLVHLHADGAAELVGTAGTALGILPAIQLSPTVVHLSPGDSLIAYTDGVVEQRRRLGSGRLEQFGHARLLQAASAAADLDATQIVSHIRETIADFGPEPQYDDVALLVVRAMAAEPVEAA
jgi:serine phosphatase RsbU (regulator of sigma subunit)/anti-sigma regulatory factor (Ser/Thr protein kinase)